MDPVGCDESPPTGDRELGARGAIAEDRGDSSGARLEALKVVAQLNAIGSQALANGVEQHAMQDAAVNRELRPCIPRGEAAGLTPDALAPLRVVRELAALGRGGFERGSQSELLHLPHGVGQQVDAHAEHLQLGTDSNTRTRKPTRAG